MLFLYYMSSKILVTGFDRFGSTRRPNSSSEIALPAVQEKYGELVDTLVLPTARDIAAEQLLDTIRTIEPLAVVMFGISAGSKVRLEQRAKNWKYNLLVADNQGGRALGKIDSGGPSAYDTTLPLGNIYNCLNDAGIPTKFSKNAGSFICNEVMYKALQHGGENHDTRPGLTGFIHFGNGLNDQLVADAAILVVSELIKSCEAPAQ
jgi:pyroglutamyl-peptidase